jgi:hypothetical protein
MGIYGSMPNEIGAISVAPASFALPGRFQTQNLPPGLDHTRCGPVYAGRCAPYCRIDAELIRSRRDSTGKL